MPDVFAPTPVKGQVAPGAAAPSDNNVPVLPAVASNLAPTLTEGTQVLLSVDNAGRLRVVLSDPTEGAGGALDVDVTDRAARLLGVASLDAATLTALESVDLNVATRDDIVTRLSTALESVDLNTTTRDDLVTRLSTNLESVDLNVATRDDLVTRLTAAITDLRDVLSTNLEQITPQVRGADVSDANPLPVNIQTNPGALVDSGLLTAADLAPGASATLASAAIATGTGSLVELTAASSVRIKVLVRSSTGGATPTLTDERVFFVDPTSDSLVYVPVDRDAITAPTGGVFQVVITNMDNLRTADVYASVTHTEL